MNDEQQTTKAQQPEATSMEEQDAKNQGNQNLPNAANSSEDELPPLTLWQMIGSALSAAIGVQSSKNRERDFARGKASHFIIIGVGFTAIFVVLMALLVRFILSQVT